MPGSPLGVRQVLVRESDPLGEQAARRLRSFVLQTCKCKTSKLFFTARFQCPPSSLSLPVGANEGALIFVGVGFVRVRFI